MRSGIFTSVLLLLFNLNFAQQNFFNVASSDITSKNKVFFQQQLNVGKDMFQSNSTFDYGLGNNFEVGINLLGLSFEKNAIGNNYHMVKNDTEMPYSSFLLVNAQKKFELDETFALGIGMQEGLTLTEHKYGGGYYYFNGVFKDEKIGLKYILGLYYASNSFVGKGARLFNQEEIGLQTGIEKKIWKDKLLLQADFISGKHTLGEVVLGGAYCMTSSLIFSAGYQLPTFNSTSVDSFVFELTFVPK